ncbi:hypothetical protein [Microlunatus sp. Gsoil 973]|uniref:hypothetical protein n=1 Tax=Microlunatus sp. Gsoil 973 TaxID=2672569 RepID=UPI0012B4901C|nr:hypothetical protein [Microlunatus sp. Gsoil 973]QGN32563.1 hypothetical protein GJV80_06845 [Microlunatus sp. Gsoil 973]
MSSSSTITKVVQALAVAIMALGISLVGGISAASAEPTSTAGTRVVAKAGIADRSAETQTAVASSGSYCHGGPRPVYSCGPYANYYVCEAMADIFRMFGDYPATCWYFPHGNLGGGPGFYF